MARSRNTPLVAVILFLAVAVPAHADKCAGAKLKAIGKKEKHLLGCQAKVAATGDSSRLSACEAKATAKFGDAYAKAGDCAGGETECENIALACESSVAGAFIDAFPSACAARKRKAAGRLAMRELGCYSKAAKMGLPVDDTCMSNARRGFSDHLTKAGTCPDGGSPQTFVESHCVNPAVETDGGGLVISVCGSPRCTTAGAPCGASGGECHYHTEAWLSGCNPGPGDDCPCCVCADYGDCGIGLCGSDAECAADEVCIFVAVGVCCKAR